MRWRPMLCFALACSVQLVAACTREGGGRQANRPPASTLTFNISEDPHSLNPILAQSDDERQAGHLMFDLLLDVDPSGRPIPALASAVPTLQNHGVSADGRTITYHLRAGVRWQDGEPFSARDVIFTWHAIMDPSNDVAGTRGYDLIQWISAPDPLTVVIRLKSAWAPATATLFTYGTNPMPILPAHLLEGHGSLRSSPFNLHPMGTGPYRFVRWDRGNRIVLAANPSYFRGAPKMQNIVVEEVPDINTSMTMLRSNQLDWSLLSPAQRLALGKPRGMHFVFAPFSGFGAIAFNCRKPPFDDVRMRRAIAMAIDRDRLSSGITRGQYRVIDSDQPPFSWAYDRTAALPKFDAAGADKLLDSLGWRRETGGMRRKAGEPLAITFTTFPEGDTAVRTAEYVQRMLGERGIDVSVKKVSVAQFYLPKAQKGLLMSGSYDMAYIAWRTGEDPDDSDITTCAGVSNYAGFCDGALDRLEGQALVSASRERRKALYGRIQQLLAADVPYEFLYAPTYSFAVNDSVNGFRPTPFSPTWDSYEWRRVRP